MLTLIVSVEHRNFYNFFLVIFFFKADGIAMGSASSAGSKLEMQILVFVAIMLHKVNLFVII